MKLFYFDISTSAIPLKPYFNRELTPGDTNDGRRSAREMHWVLQVIGFCPERTKGISEWISGIATRLPIDVATRRGCAAQPPAEPLRERFTFALSSSRLESFVDPCEQIRLHLARHRLHSGGQMKHFHPSALPHVSFEYGPQWRLGVMCFECCDLGFKSVADINHSGRRRESNRLPAGQCEIRS